MTSNITTTTDNNKMVLLWSRCSSYDVVDLTSLDVNSSNNNDVITTTIQSYEIVGRSFFSGRNLENIITNMENDPLALSVWVSKQLDKIIISKQKKKKRSRKEE